MDTVVGLFENYYNADRAVQALYDYGVDGSRISVITRDNEKLYGTYAKAGAATTGAVTGGLIGLLAGVSSLFIPGFGPVIATGMIASALASAIGTTAIGAGIGAATGGLLGALVDLGLSKKDAKFYAEGINRGGTLVSVLSNMDEKEKIREILSSAGAVDLDTYRPTWEGDDLSELEEGERFEEEADRF